MYKPWVSREAEAGMGAVVHGARTVRSSDPDASKNSLGLKASAPTGPLCDENVCMSLPAVRSQIWRERWQGWRM